jgi:hypothetical protein
MRIENERLLAEFRHAARCEWCGKRTPQGCDPAHLFSRGAGRVDVRDNLAALCRECHTKQHAGNEPTVEQLLVLVAKREGKTPQTIRNKIARIRRDTSKKVWVVE